MARFDSAIKVAQRLIAKNGQDAILRRYSDAPAPDGDKPWRTGSPSSSGVPVRAVFLNMGDMGERYMQGTEVQIGDKLVLIAGGDLAEPPDLRDRIHRDGGGPDDEGWSIIKVVSLDPNGQQVLHQLQVRQ